MKDKYTRLKRAKKIRGKISLSGKHRLTVFKSDRHLYTQIFSPDGKVITSANTLEKGVLKRGSSCNLKIAKQIGKLIAERAIKKDIKEVAFDRSGFIYHGRVKALAESAREAGLKF